jgi:hypothetical protein
LEDEQRYVVTALPAAACAPRLVEDRYLTGTRLRLRVVTDDAGSTRKLGHKVPVDAARPSVVWHTTCYLDEREFATLAVLDAASLAKRRWSLADGVADEFLGALRGLVLLEGARPFRPPVPAVEVTDDSRFCGGALAALDDDGAARLVALAAALR